MVGNNILCYVITDLKLKEMHTTPWVNLLSVTSSKLVRINAVSMLDLKMNET